MLRHLLLASAILATPAAAQQISAEANTRDALRRIEALNPQLRAVLAVEPAALDEARRWIATAPRAGRCSGCRS
jgi:Asp-tRNA(Asn)/Glu-tRNA(Gln) amidotransferase A subunit family amidase